jgi:hypothetical protein
MTLINASLCLPELDIMALSQKRSIVAMTQRFIVPDRSFALLPCRILPEEVQLSDLYHPQVLADLQPYILPVTKPMKATHWAECTFCQPITDDEAVAAVSDRTSWTKTNFLNHLQNRGKLFLSFLRVYALPIAMPIETEPDCEQLYKFLPLPQYIEVERQGAVLSDAEFIEAKQSFFEPAKILVHHTHPTEDDKIVDPLPEREDVVDSSDWVSKIVEIGHSSDGHNFEKFVRKGLVELGFSNSQSKVIASLDPEKTGGAGGLDFYADRPYAIVGECKATQGNSVGDPATQLHRLGIKFLEGDFAHCIKLIVAAGKVTSQANKLAKAHGMNIISPKTMQRLVKSKLDFQDEFDIIQLKSRLEQPVFGEDADRKLNDYLDWCSKNWQETKEYNQLVIQVMNSLKELSSQSINDQSADFSAKEIRAHHNAKHQPIVPTSKIQTVLEHELRAQNSEIKLRDHGNERFGYYLKEIAPKR